MPVLFLLPLAFDETLEYSSSRRVSKFSQRFGFNLANPLSGHIEILADFLQGPLMPFTIQSKPHADYSFLTWA